MPEFLRTLVAGVASLDVDDPVLRFGTNLATQAGATLHAVHAVMPPQELAAPLGGTMLDPLAASWAPAMNPAVWDDLRKELGERLAEAVHQLDPAGTVVARVMPGSASEVLVRAAEDVRPELLLVGATRRGRIGQTFLGTTAGHVLNHTHTPLLVVRESILSAPAARVLLTTDLSDLSTRAFRLGLDLVRGIFGAHAGPEIRCLLVAGYDPALVPPPNRDKTVRAATVALRDFVRRHAPAGITVESVVRAGDAAEEIVIEAREWQADLVALGTHGHSGLRHLLVGSVAEAVVRDAPCNVLVVPPPAAQESRSS